MKNLTDEELMRYVSGGNLDYMRLLFERYHKWVYNYFMQMIRDKDVSQDLTQSTFYKALKYKESYKGGKFASWIFQIARNLNADYFREQAQKHKHEHIENIPEKPEEVEDHDDVAKLKLVLRKLPESDREILVMSRFQGMKYVQIAEVLESTEAAVKLKAHRAIKKLRKLYFESVEI